MTRRILRDFGRAPAPVWDLPGQDGSFRQEVVGESMHEAQFSRLLKGVYVTSNGVDLDEKASLVPQSRTRCDPLAVAVVIRGETVGHLPKVDAARFHSTLLAATKAGQDPQVDALWCARTDDEVSGMVSNRVRLDLAALEVVTSPESSGMTSDLATPCAASTATGESLACLIGNDLDGGPAPRPV